jgi:hypothetical protein
MAELVGVYDATPAPRDPGDVISRPGQPRTPTPGPHARGTWLSASITHDIPTVITTADTVAFADDWFGQAGPMRRRAARVPVPRSGFVGFRFPPEVIILTVRWYLRFGLSYRDVEELLAALQHRDTTVHNGDTRALPARSPLEETGSR